MSIGQLIMALERRGYRVRLLPYREESQDATLLRIFLVRNGQKGFMDRVISAYELDHLFDANRYLDCILQGFSGGQYHVQHSCGYPLLYKQKRGVLYRGKIVLRTRELMREMRPSDWYQEQNINEYRDVDAGPESPVLKDCPKCKAALSSETVKEIRDDA